MRMDKLTSRFQQALSDTRSLVVGRDNNAQRHEFRSSRRVLHLPRSHALAFLWPIGVTVAEAPVITE